MTATPPHRWPTVQLLHELPDGSAHVDWLLATDPNGEAPLITFRLPRRVDELRMGETMDAQRIADHRPAYLSYEGPVSGDRGTVRRLRAGRVAAFDPREPVWILDLTWTAGADRRRHQRLRLEFRGPTCRIVAESP